MGAAQPERGGGDRGEEVVQALRAARDAPADQREDPQRDDDPGDELGTAGLDLPEQPVAHDDEEHDEDRDVEDPLGEQRADHRAHREAGPRGHEDDADRVAGAIGFGVNVIEGVYLVALASVFSMIPSGPAYAGTQDAAAIIGLKALGSTGAQAVAFIVMLRFVIVVPITVVGLVLLASRYGGLRRLRAMGTTA